MTTNIVHLGVVGLGRFAEHHLAVLSTLPQARISALCSRDPERASELARKYQVPRTYTDVQSLVHDPRIDAVDIVTEEQRHLAQVLPSIEAGKPVFVEKPIATTLEDADRMITAAREKGVLLMPGHILRFDPRYTRVKELVETDELGRVSSIFCRRNTCPEAILRRPLPPLLRTSIHDFDLLLWYLQDRVVEIYCVDNCASGAPFSDTWWTVLRFANGAIGVCETVCLVPDKAPNWLDTCMEVIGTEGTVRVDALDQGVSLWTNERSVNLDLFGWPTLHGRSLGPLREELQYFVECVRSSREPTVISPEDAREAVRLALLAQKSAEERRIITLERNNDKEKAQC